MKKRILIFSFAYYPHVGGAEVAIRELTDRLGGDFEFDMITLQFSKKDLPVEKMGNLTIYRKRLLSVPFFLQKGFFPIMAFVQAYELHKKNNYDLIWSIMASYAGFAGMFFKYRFPRVPFLLTIQEGENFGRRKIFKFLFKKIFRRADRITVISTFLEKWARQMGAVCPIDVVPNGVDVQEFKVQSEKLKVEEMGETRKKYGFKEGDVVLITTSRLVPKNRVEDVIEAMKFLPENVKFLILGSGPLESSLTLHATRFKLQDRVHFVGFVSHVELPSYLHSANIFIRTPISEGFGNSFVEAMASGLPVVATPVGGIVDFLKDGETGIFSRIRDVQNIADMVKKLMNDPELRERIISNASKMVAEKYDWNLIALKMARVLGM